jgi:protein-L-isoaspartate(D-aspartate) O-methyltransferase
MTDQTTFERQRQTMVARQIEARGIRDPALLQAMRRVPREQFVLEKYRASAYDDAPLPIPAEQTISQPYVVALMIHALNLDAEGKVLEVGSGSGYASAILSRMVREVHAVERHQALVDYARQRLQKLGYDNVHVHHADGSKGWPDAAPYDGILVSASGPRVPTTLEEQLAIGGSLIMPIGRARGMQTLVRLTRVSRDDYRERNMGGVRFVPLIGEEGW